MIYQLMFYKLKNIELDNSHYQMIQYMILYLKNHVNSFESYIRIK